MEKNLIPIRPVQKDLLYTKIADGILRYIKENKLKSGDKIPSERMLAEHFATSRNSVREALRVLENEKVLEVKTGRGTFLTSDVEMDTVSVKLFKVDYEELLETKYMLECGIIRKFCETQKEYDFSYPEEALQQVEQAAAENIFLQKVDYTFHSRLRHMMENTMLEQLIDNINIILDDYGNTMLDVEPIWLTTVPYHRQMLEAIKKKEVVRALQAHRKIYEIDKYAIHSMVEKINSTKQKI